MANTPIIESIKLKIGDHHIEITLAQARELKRALNELLPEASTFSQLIQQLPVQDHRPRPPWRPGEITCQAVQTGGDHLLQGHDAAQARAIGVTRDLMGSGGISEYERSRAITKDLMGSAGIPEHAKALEKA